ILEALGGDAQPARRVAVAARIGREERDPGAVDRADAQALEEAGDHLGEARRVALLYDKAVLPAVDEGIALAAPEVDDLVGHREAAPEARDRVGLADEEGDRAVAEVRLEPRARRREPAVARDDEHAARRAGGDGVEGAAQRLEARAQRARRVGGARGRSRARATSAAPCFSRKG